MEEHTPQSFLGHLWDLLHPDFAPPQKQKKPTQTPIPANKDAKPKKEKQKRKGKKRKTPKTKQNYKMSARPHSHTQGCNATW